MQFGTCETAAHERAGVAIDPQDARSIVIVWHSMTGASRQLSVAVARGAARASGVGGSRPVATTRVHARQVSIEQLLAASAFIFVAPENLGSMAGVMKAFFDRSYYPLLDRVQGRAYATIVAAGSDGNGAARQIGRICQGWRLREATRPLIVLTNAQTPEQILAPKRVTDADLAQAAEIGEALAEGVGLGIY